MSPSLLTPYDIATLKRHPNPKLIIFFDPSTSKMSIVDTIHIQENLNRGYPAFAVDYSRIVPRVLEVQSLRSAVDVVTSRLRSGYAASGVILSSKRFGAEGETMFDLTIAKGR
jgi:hypothetical protein